ncbi:MAG: dihydroorotate dehydrogenase electron transfer subunit [bacterium]|nr:dihydroorotate dehydrogenase electron transfer subunit [bacterium]
MRKMARITENRRESAWTHTLFFDAEIACSPGQFVMVWLPGRDEKPFTLSYPNAITVKRAGGFTEQLTELEAGEVIGLRGPLGRGYPALEKPVLIGGGVGIAELRLLALACREPTFILGGRTADEILFHDEFQKLGPVHVATEDDSLGVRGLVTDLLPVEGKSYAVCGPERMMTACLAQLPPARSFFAIERYMKCAVGLCGQCTCSGWRVCVDGPVFSGESLRAMSDFGRRRRAKSGRWEAL